MAASAVRESGWRRLAAALLALLCVVWLPAAAHPMPESRVWLDSTDDGLRLTLQLPLNRLEFAFGQALSDAPASVLGRHGEALTAYLLQHVGARGADGQGWQVLRPTLEIIGADASAELQAVMMLRAPAGADPRRLTLLYDAIIHEVRTHRVLVLLRKDWSAGFVGEAPLLLGELNHGTNSLPVELQAEQPGASLLRLLQHGARHIAEGSDHLLFLVLLLVVAPLAGRRGRWQSVRTARDALMQLLKVVSAFTLGHSLTLALGSTGLLTPLAQPVEIAVAASIVVAALHALRPLFANGELAMALLFGLVHGLAFSASLSGAGLTPWQHAQALLAFNLGIEAMQLAIVAAVVPPLLLLSRASARGYRALRVGIALAGAVLALLWCAERAGCSPVDVAALTALAEQTALPLLALCWLAAAMALLAARRARQLAAR